MRMFRNVFSVIQKSTKLTKQAFWYTGNLRGIVWNSGCFEYSQVANILARAIKCAKKRKEDSWQFKRWSGDEENLEDHGCPEV